MADKYDKNGYNSSDFKRNSNQDLAGQADDSMGQDGEGPKLNEKAGEYMRDLLNEKIKLNNTKFPVACKLIDQEVSKVQSTGRITRDNKYVDVFREKNAKVSVKVLVPVKDHPKFNFVGKLLGPKGSTMQYLQEETMCKMSILGRGSMRDRQKEEELRNSLDPRYAHLSDELHVEISAIAPPAEAHARIAYALAEVKKYLIPDPMEMMRPPHPPHPMMMERDGGGAPRHTLLERPEPAQGVQYTACTITKRSFSYQGPILSAPPRPGPPGRGPPRMPPAPPPMGRPMPGKSKVISILDRARNAMEDPYSYDDPYAAEPQGYSTQGYSTQGRGGPRAAPESDFYYDRSERYYEDEPYYKDTPPAREYKGARDGGVRRPGGPQRPAQPHFARASPYARPPKTAPKKQRLQ